MLGDFTTLYRLLLEGRLPPYLPIVLLSPWQEVRERGDPPGCCSLASSVLLLFVSLLLSKREQKWVRSLTSQTSSSTVIEDPEEYYMRLELSIYTHI